MSHSQFLTEIKKLKEQGVILGDLETIETSEKIITEHSRDASVFDIQPEMVLFCKNIDDIQTVLRTAHQYHIEGVERPIISVRAGGTCMSGGSLNTGLILNMTRYMNEIEIDPPTTVPSVVSGENGADTSHPIQVYTATVSMGAMFRDIEKAADQFGLMFAPYTSSKDICGIGGMIGNNASGEKSVRLGSTIDAVLGLEVILADGTLIRTGVLQNTGEELPNMLRATELKKELAQIRVNVGADFEKSLGQVSKVASGYRLERISMDGDAVDLTPIFIGAQGTLGIVTRAVLKLVAKPDHTRLLVVSVDSIQELPFILETIMRHNPECVETFDINTYERAKNILKKETDFCAHFFNQQTTLVILAQFSEVTKAATDALANEAEEEICKHKVRVECIKDEEIQDAIWKIRRASFAVMRDFNRPGFHAVPCIEDIIVPIHEFNRLIPGLTTVLQTHELEYGFHGHIGDGSLRIIPVFDFSQGREKVAEQIISLAREVFTLVKLLGGNMSADHSDGIIRTPFIREFYGEKVFEAFVKTKLLFDPNGILNRGKKVGGTEEMIKKYLIKE